LLCIYAHIGPKVKSNKTAEILHQYFEMALLLVGRSLTNFGVNNRLERSFPECCYYLCAISNSMDAVVIDNGVSPSRHILLCDTSLIGFYATVVCYDEPKIGDHVD
jgi:hypothetical protein